MRFWIPILGSLFAAAFIARIDPNPFGIMAGLVASLTGLDVATHLDE
jgi:hypothetical protein